MEPNDPRKAILTFLSGLPQTIKADMLLFVIIYAINRDVPDNTAEFESVVREYLLRRGMGGIGAVICSAAVIDHQLEGLVSKLDSAEAGLKMLTGRHPENVAFQQSHLSLPLRRRHWEQALAEWKRLRTTQLTPQMLRDFADSQLSPPRQR